MLTETQVSVEAPGAKPYARMATWFLVLSLVPTALVMTLMSRHKTGREALMLQNTCLAVAIVAGAIAAVDWLRNRRQRGATLAMLAAGACAAIILMIVWNKLFRYYIKLCGYELNAFRRIFHTIFAPIYARMLIPPLSWWMLLIVAAAAAVGWEMLRKGGQGLSDRGVIWRIMFYQLALTIAFAGTESIVRITEVYAGYSSFHRDVPSFSSVSDLLRNYVQKMPQLSNYNSHYPPGNLLTCMIAENLGGKWPIKAFGTLLPILAQLPLLALARELGLNRWTSVLAGMLFAVSAGVLIFPTIAITAVPIFFASLCLWLLTRALKRGEFWAAITFGLTFAVYFFFSFASYMLALVMGIFLLAALITKVVSMSRAASVLLISIGTFIVFFAVLKLIWGFNIIDCYSMAQQMHLQRPGHGFDHPLRYLFRSTGGIIAYLISTSLAIPLLAIAAIARRHDEDRLRRAFTIGTLLGLLLSGFSGMSFLETERIWLIFTPALAVIAAAEMERRQHLEGHPLAAAVVLAALTFSCGYELISRHHTWKPDAWLEKHQMELESNSGSTAPPDAAPAARLSEATRFSKADRGTPC